MEFQGLEWEKLSLCGWMCVSAWIENHIAEILQVPGFEQPQWDVDSPSWNFEMWGVYWRQKVIVWEAVIYVHHCAHCVGPSTSMLSTRTHTQPSFTWWSCFLHPDTHWLSQPISFSCRVQIYVFSYWMRGSCGLKYKSTSCERWPWQAFILFVVYIEN